MRRTRLLELGVVCLGLGAAKGMGGDEPRLESPSYRGIFAIKSVEFGSKPSEPVRIECTKLGTEVRMDPARRVQVFFHDCLQARAVPTGERIILYSQRKTRSSSYVRGQRVGTEPQLFNFQGVATGEAFRRPVIKASRSGMEWYEGVLEKKDPYRIRLTDDLYVANIAPGYSVLRTRSVPEDQLKKVLRKRAVIAVIGQEREIPPPPDSKARPTTRIEATDVHILDRTLARQYKPWIIQAWGLQKKPAQKERGKGDDNRKGSAGSSPR